MSRILPAGILRMSVVFAVLCGAARGGEFEVLRDIPFVERDSETLKADVYLPDAAGPLPGVIAIHGGSWLSGDKSRMIVYCEKLAAAGFTAVSINYRLAPKDQFPAQIEDCKAAVRWMRKNAATYKLDPQRLGGLGYSAGGHLAALLGTTDVSSGLEGADTDGTDTRLQCVVAGGAPCDFRAMPADLRRLAYWLGGTRAEKPRAYELASPANFVSKDDPPMLFFHGDADTLVPIQSAQSMIAKLSAVGVPAQLYAIHDAGHIPAFHDAQATVETVKFFETHLKKPSAPAGK